MTAALSAMSLGATSQVTIDFESPESYSAIGVYDAWEKSPFRSGELTGNYAITANPDATSVNEIINEVANPSALVLGAQRSRFASNTFGVRVDLKEIWETNTTMQYVHVMLHKPTDGRVMLIGLGSRKERLAQNPYCEQFLELSTNSVKSGEWCDAVFAIKTANGVNIRSLVLVPDCESPHNLTEDFLFYIDNIEINNNPLPRIPSEFYPICGDKATKGMTRTDRKSTRMTFKVGSESQYVALQQESNKLLYQDVLTTTFFAQAGQTVTPSITYNASWMHAYCYIDYNQDGQFSYTLNEDGTPAEGSELVAYNHYEGKNSKGASANQNLGSSCGTMPSFTLPSDLKPGMYRVRMKIDWNCIDPMGNTDPNNLIAENGGVIADAMLCIYGDKVTLNDFQLNGEILAADGRKLSALEVPANEEFTILMAPEKGFHNGGVVVNCGHNPNGERLDKYGNPQYNSYTIEASEFAEDNTYTIPAKQMRGNILFNGNMVEGSEPEEVDETAYTVAFPKDLKITRTDRKLNSITIDTELGEVTISLDDNTENFVYVDKTKVVEIPVKAGETIIPSVNYTGRAMHNYWYIDFDENGAFSTNLNENGTPAGELLSYSYFDGKNSLGETISGAAGDVSVNDGKAFVIPANTPAGVYRCRLKIDWNSVDPQGTYGLGKNDMHDNAGYVVDFMFHVYDEVANVTTNATEQYGNFIADGVEFGATYAAPRNEALEISTTTTNGAKINNITARHGYHFEYEKPRKLNQTYWTENILTATNDKYIIPAEKMDRPVRLTVQFDGLDGISEITILPTDADAYDLRGIRVDKPSKGIFIVNGQKTIIK